MRCRRGVDNQRLRIADVGEIARQPQIIDDLAANGRIVRLHAKAEHAAVLALPQVLLGDLVRRVVLQAGVGHPSDFGVRFEVLSQGERVR